MIKKFHVLYVGQIELDNVGLDGTPANERRYSDERLRPALDLMARIPAEAPRRIVDPPIADALANAAMDEGSKRSRANIEVLPAEGTPVQQKLLQPAPKKEHERRADGGEQRDEPDMS